MNRKVSDTRSAPAGDAGLGGGRAARIGGVARSGGAAAVAFLGPYAVSLAALAGLVVATIITLQLFGGTIPIIGSAGGDGGDPAAPILAPGRTPSPSAPPVINKDISIAGAIVYVKAGNLWIEEKTEVRQLTRTGRDSQPAWSADGQWIYFVETRQSRGKYPDPETGALKTFDLHYPILTRIHPDGSGREAILSGLYRPTSSQKYFYFIKGPAVSPDGTQVAVTSDGPVASQNNVVLQIVDVKRKRMTNLGLSQYRVLGHQDPAWSPDGAYLVYVKNGADGPAIWRYTVNTKKAKEFTDTGYTQPIYSPDGRYIAATKTNTLSNNVVILDARTGAELTRVTNDDRSWGPAWSPDGTQLVFMTLAKSGLTVDIHLAAISRAANGVPLVDGDVKALTKSSGLDGDSRPAWWGEPATSGATPAPTVSVTASPGPSGAATPVASPASP